MSAAGVSVVRIQEGNNVSNETKNRSRANCDFVSELRSKLPWPFVESFFLFVFMFLYSCF
jgi:hypothetical protein